VERFRRFIRNWLGFSRTETNGFLIFLPLLLILIIARPLYRAHVSGTRSEALDSVMLDRLVEKWNHDLAMMHKDSISFELFSFDPNTIKEDDLLKLGFSKHLTKRIAGYRSKGGVFRVKRDLLKMYGMDSTLYRQLHAYILLPEQKETKDKRRTVQANKTGTTVPYSAYKKKEKKQFDLNTADTMQLKQVYGIGETLSLRIVRLRDALGGFINETQLREVYGLDSASAERLSESAFISEDFHPVLLDVNTADEKTLAAHPYIRKSLARIIITYRFQHGNFKETNEIKKITSIPPHQADKILPYLTVTD
jgi:competence protein ComEA